MQEFKNEEFHLEVHEKLEIREASLEFMEMCKNSCKFCGQEEHKIQLCSSCYFEHKSQIASRLGFISGWLLSSGAAAFTVSSMGGFIVALGLSGGVLGFHLSKIFVSKNSAPSIE